MDDCDRPEYHAADINKDGVLDKQELDFYKEREKYQRKMSYISLAAIIITASFLLVVVDADKLSKFDDILDMYFITLGGVIATSMGVGAWATKRN